MILLLLWTLAQAPKAFAKRCHSHRIGQRHFQTVCNSGTPLLYCESTGIHFVSSLIELDSGHLIADALPSTTSFCGEYVTHANGDAIGVIIFESQMFYHLVLSSYKRNLLFHNKRHGIQATISLCDYVIQRCILVRIFAYVKH